MQIQTSAMPLVTGSNPVAATSCIRTKFSSALAKLRVSPAVIY
jgi:hypothetical protein